MIRIKYWVRDATLSERRLCKRKSIFFFVVSLIMFLYIAQWKNELLKTAITKDLFSGLVIINLVPFSLFLDGILVLFGIEKVCVGGPRDYRIYDKWYNFFLPYTEIMGFAWFIFIAVSIVFIGYHFGEIIKIFIQ